MEHAVNFMVCNPARSVKGDYVEYTVIGIDKVGNFDVLRRYSDFVALRKALTDRYVGLYIPPIPAKKAIGNTTESFVNERCFLLNLFIRQLARCPYLVESEEFEIFVRPSQENLQMQLTLLPNLSPENMLTRIQDYFSFIGNISERQMTE